MNEQIDDFGDYKAMEEEQEFDAKCEVVFEIEKRIDGKSVKYTEESFEINAVSVAFEWLKDELFEGFQNLNISVIKKSTYKGIEKEENISSFEINATRTLFL